MALVGPWTQVAAEDFATWPQELQPFARSSLRKANTMFDVLEHAFEGTPHLPFPALADRVQYM
jgi:hypothetical protein